MRVPNSTVSVSDTSGGVAVAFTTTGDVTELRRRVRHMAEMHSRHHAGARMGGRRGAGAGEHPMGPGRMMGQQMMIASTSAFEEIEGGARIVLTPSDPSGLEALRAQVRAHAERMSRGECPMMVMHAPAERGGEEDWSRTGSPVVRLPQSGLQHHARARQPGLYGTEVDC